MEIKKITKKKLNTYEILLSDNTKLNLYDDTIIYFNLLSNKTLDAKKIAEISTYNSRIEAYFKTIKYLSTKLRTKGEIEKKLKTLGYSKDTIIITIERLEKEGYLDNDLYIKSYVTDQVNLTLKGPKKILQELIKLGFKEEKIYVYLDAFDTATWAEKVDKIINKKSKGNHNLSSRMFLQKLKKDLINMGYNIELINNKLADLNLADNQEILEKELKKELKKLARKYAGDTLTSKVKYNLYKKGFSIDNIESILKEYVH